MTFWIPWAVDAVIGLVSVSFFLIGLGDGTVSSFNILLWLATLLTLAAILGGSLWLRAHGRHRPAIGLAWVLAAPGLAYGLFIIVVLITQPRWN
jgi:hypothetical protein